MLKVLKNLFKQTSIKIDKAELTRDPLPDHIAIIMDGNGRWASRRGLPRAAGHRAGVESLKRAVETCAELGVSYLTVYAFSTENWKRPQEEINALMELLVEYIEKELHVLKQNNVRIKTIGDITELPTKALSRIKKAEQETADNKQLYLQIALNYGGRKELIEAVKKISADVLNKKIQTEKIEEKIFISYLYTAGIPDPDLLIRTAGEKRLSNFLLWQSAYTEFWFTDVFWPDFTAQHLYQAINDYQHRQRRFGGLKK